MNFAVHANPPAHTHVIEIGPGKYQGRHFQSGFVFVDEVIFRYAEGIVEKYVETYSHWACNDIPAEIGRQITRDWRNAARRMPGLTSVEVQRVLNLDDSWRYAAWQVAASHGPEIARMLDELATACDEFLDRTGWMCILGM